nr:MAG TPA: hypothetical protein [Caudoviricetes sp.]
MRLFILKQKSLYRRANDVRQFWIHVNLFNYIKLE